ncbi:MAG: hypothetical protein HY619_00755, partial [Thaumarchaeota archaeon]|nr:hypothetical protein [Nitrososphaerota archaeon]
MPTLRMNGANSLSIFIIVTLLLSIFTWAPWAQAAEHDYREDLTIFAVGSVGYWRLGFHGGNITLSGLSSIESEASGVEAYSLFGARSRQWSPSYEYFTDRGFGVLDYNLIPTEGMILTVNADSAENAQRFASQLGSIIEGSFTPVDFGLGNFTFYSHTDFTRLVNKYLRGSIPFYYG